VKAALDITHICTKFALKYVHIHTRAVARTIYFPLPDKDRIKVSQIQPTTVVRTIFGPRSIFVQYKTIAADQSKRWSVDSGCILGMVPEEERVKGTTFYKDDLRCRPP
jgi:hypothetical protein